MKKLLSLPPNLVEHFHEITGYSKGEWFCTNDPINHKLGSGGGTSWLLHEAWQAEGDGRQNLTSWLSAEKRIIMHAGGQSRRLPSYAPSGKVLIPIPVFRWARGQKLSQNLLSLQMALYEKMLAKTPDNVHTMIVNGDVYIRNTRPIRMIPEADVVCYGLWLDSDIAKDHGVFISKRNTPHVLDRMVQKPTVDELAEISKEHFFLTDIGIWFLSDRAVEVLYKKSVDNEGGFKEYDLYSEFGCSLGENPVIEDADLAGLKVVVLPLEGGEFYHYGSSPEIISSTLAIQNLVNDQRAIMHRKIKAQPSVFTQNTICKIPLAKDNPEIWIENSYVGEHWTIAKKHIITGVPENNWNIDLQEGDCIDIIPVGEKEYCARVYGFYDKFAGDAQQEKRFPVTSDIDELGEYVKLQLEARHNGQGTIRNDDDNDDDDKTTILRQTQEPRLNEVSLMLSAEEISNVANLIRLEKQRKAFRAKNLSAIAENYENSVFYQLDLNDAAHQFAANNISMPPEIKKDAPLMTKIRDCMFRSEFLRLQDKNALVRQNSQQVTSIGSPILGISAEDYYNDAFTMLSKGVVSTVLTDKQSPRMSVYPDQIVWGRSPVRVDIAGGWTDTPPYCLNEGGNVVNFAMELNGQAPLHCYVKMSKEPHIVLRSIDLGAIEIIKTYEELADFNHVGSPFSIPKAALVLAGFQPGFSNESYPSLEAQLKAFGCGMEISTLAAIPAGSGLGTSSVLASTVLGTVRDFCGLAWDKNEIGKRTLVLEQLLTTGGGWQDQFGGIMQGVKLLQTTSGLEQNPAIRWLPDNIWSEPEYKPCHLLYYTGITRTAKKLLAEIVRKMFLNDSSEHALLAEMKQHAIDMYEAIQHCNFEEMGRLVRKTWQQNQLIDAGTNPPEVQRIASLIDDYCYGYKLGGAGGGGYMYIVAKDAEAAMRIKQTLNANRQNANERFVEMNISKTGLQVSRS